MLHTLLSVSVIFLIIYGIEGFGKFCEIKLALMETKVQLSKLFHA